MNVLSVVHRCSTLVRPLLSFGLYAMDMYSITVAMFLCKDLALSRALGKYGTVRSASRMG